MADLYVLAWDEGTIRRLNLGVRKDTEGGEWDNVFNVFDKTGPLPVPQDLGAGVRDAACAYDPVTDDLHITVTTMNGSLFHTKRTKGNWVPFQDVNRVLNDSYKKAPNEQFGIGLPLAGGGAPTTRVAVG